MDDRLIFTPPEKGPQNKREYLKYCINLDDPTKHEIEVVTIDGNSKTSTRKYFSSKAKLESFEATFKNEQTENDNDRINNYFSVNPNGVVEKQFGHAFLSVHIVKSEKVAKELPLARRHWYSHFKITVFV